MTGLRNIPSVLSFSKKLIPSDGIFSGTSQHPDSPVTPLTIQMRTARGTFAFRRKNRGKEEKISGQKIHDPNIRSMDYCMLGAEQNVIMFRFSLKITGGLKYPAACNNEIFRQRYQAVITDYLEREHCGEPARRYAHNIGCGRFLWRNQVGAEHIEVVVDNLSAEKKQQWVFDARKYSLRHFEQTDNTVSDLGKHIAAALSCDDGALLLAVSARVITGKGQEVFPSCEFVMNKRKGGNSRILCHIDGTAGMHSQKIGNALRSVDTWYPAFSDLTAGAGVIAADPYGAVTHLGAVFRPPGSGQDFYTLFEKWVSGKKLAEHEENYVVAVLIRGGVFGGGG
ncbi:type I-F CRISPR-associated protein Csy3 [Morganella morganii]|uniref:type I-F CRISPR-associated protein Csy3 n=1 Tax=Morganella morganii TaxID=582 RepID=UPI001BD96632|nr:type I-F CRISPR-associated protein Csy3 [Morganella morganii]ELF0882827.1 type I-F CRISPR-associated protein Csy3 [Morganella morganii]MBT0387078.1 type I-F CRISPR-associated protein Csy3 [Morganella morganii subsp. morganii]MBT0518119.1 type I-F CRISPR-associated protein Csy3 [Morganella morganii subsp. morganii]QWL90809.1 type I-F CRISPR-associated protein Csy3 [Morganella morganii subsp. morganii]HCR3197525.1 type I-F CRISPR-associated protein Csy3 [Morganella morganii]